MQFVAFAANSPATLSRPSLHSSLKGVLCPFPSRSALAVRPKMSASPKVHVGDVPGKLGAIVREKSAAAISQRGAFTIAISGGSLPKLLSQALNGDVNSSHIDFSNWVVFLADERIVPLDDTDSNYRSIKSFFPTMEVIPIDPSLTPAQCASHYQAALTEKLGDSPMFDAVLLGLGPDGHTCSLFPDHPLLSVSDGLVAHIEDSPKPPPQRVTLTIPVLNASSSAIFVCTGAGKAPVVKDILENPGSSLPGALVRPTNGSCDWLLDEGAATELTSSASAGIAS